MSGSAHAFAQINQNFGELFQELFGGGRGEMSLIDADDVLESGIDVIAQPPGKRLQNVLLLSGGEKAMAALALVLGIFHYRPAPFCLLDEVDAPLDEANIGRFTNKVVQMSANTQFIVITHNKRTMEMARALVRRDDGRSGRLETRLGQIRVNQTKRFTLLVTAAALLVLSAAIFSVTAQTVATPQTPADTKTNTRQQSQGQRREDNKKAPDGTKYSYEFSQPQFDVSHIVIEHDASGQGKITFERQGQAAPIVGPMVLSTGALGRILGLWTALQFLESTENYQSDKQFPHLGTMRLSMEQGTRKRTAEFNWSNNKEAASLATEYRRVADQAVLLFDIDIARENQPLNMPALMDLFEMYLQRGDLSDPYQLIPVLQGIATEDHLPLIARNHATRLLKKIQK